MSTQRLDRAALLRAWTATQGLAAKAGTHSAAQIVTQRSWVRTLGGGDPYFALFARGVDVGAGRAAIDAAVLAGELRMTPAVRGCMYLVGEAQADLALSLAYHHGHARFERELDRAGCSAAQLRKTTKAVLAALAKGPATTAQLRKGPAAKAIVSFGERGRLIGVSSSLPPALRRLEFDGAIERTPIDGRLDTETYRWSLRTRPLVRSEAADAHHAIAELFFRHHGPASFEHFVAWSGLGKRVAKAAIAGLELEEIVVEDQGGEDVDMWAFPASLDAAHTKSRAKPVALLGLQDLYLVVHGGPAWACPAAHHGVEIPRWGSTHGGPIGSTKHPQLRAILVAGELVGFWDVDATMEQQHLAWLERPGKTLVSRARAGVTALRGFMAEELGHAKIFALDSDARIDTRFEIVAGLGA